MEIESAEKTLKRSKMRNSEEKRAAGAPKNRVFSAQVEIFCFITPPLLLTDPKQGGVIKQEIPLISGCQENTLDWYEL